MPDPKLNTIVSNDIQVTAREIDFATRFERSWEHLRDILGIMRPIKKQPGAVLRSKYATGSLADSVAEGVEIPYSKFTVHEKHYAEMGIEKYAKAVTIEAIKDHGYDNAVQMTDDEFLYELTQNVTGRFYTYLNTGEMTDIETTWQMALAMAKGLVINKFKRMHRNATGVVGFVNVLDLYEYLGAADITIQNQFGWQYVKDFMGYNTVFLLGEDEIARGTVIATPVENIVMYYVDPADSDFARAGLSYTTGETETNLIGVHAQGNYSTAVSELFALLGLTLFAEYVDAIAVVKVEASGSLGAVTIASAAGEAAGDSKITITYTAGAGERLYYKDAAQAATPTYKEIVNLSGWKEIVPVAGGNNVEGLTASNKITVIAVNGAGQAVASGDATIVVKES